MELIESLRDIEDDRDVLEDLRRRIVWLELQDGSGYGPAIKFYKRIVERINNECTD